MDLPSQDLEEYVDKFENIFSNQKLTKKNQDDLLLLIENISSELEISRKSENVLRNNLKELLERENVNLNQKYVASEEKCSKLENENKLLLKDKEELSNLLQNELESQRNDFLKKIKDLEEKSQFEITNLKNQLESNIICHETKERELYNELQIAQAASALEWDEKESTLKTQLAEAKINLRQCQNNVCKLRFETNQLRNQLQTLQKTTPQNESTLYFQEKPIQQIKNKLIQKQYLNEINDTENEEHYKQDSMELDGPSSIVENLPKENTIYYNLRNENRSNKRTSTSSSYSSATFRDNFELTNQSRPSSSYSSSSTIQIPNINQPVRSKNIERKDLSLKQTDSSNDIEDNNSVKSVKSYQPLVMESKSDQYSYKKLDTIKDGRSVNKGNNYRLYKNNLPPLRICSDATNVNNSNQIKKTESVRKRRKLYSP